MICLGIYATPNRNVQCKLYVLTFFAISRHFKSSVYFPMKMTATNFSKGCHRVLDRIAIGKLSVALPDKRTYF